MSGDGGEVSASAGSACSRRRDAGDITTPGRRTARRAHCAHAHLRFLQGVRPSCAPRCALVARAGAHPGISREKKFRNRTLPGSGRRLPRPRSHPAQPPRAATPGTVGGELGGRAAHPRELLPEVSRSAVLPLSFFTSVQGKGRGTEGMSAFRSGPADITTPGQTRVARRPWRNGARSPLPSRLPSPLRSPLRTPLPGTRPPVGGGRDPASPTRSTGHRGVGRRSRLQPPAGAPATRHTARAGP